MEGSAEINLSALDDEPESRYNSKGITTSSDAQSCRLEDHKGIAGTLTTYNSCIIEPFTDAS